MRMMRRLVPLPGVKPLLSSDLSPERLISDAFGWVLRSQAVSAHHGDQKLCELNEDLSSLVHTSPHIHMLMSGACTRHAPA